MRIKWAPGAVEDLEELDHQIAQRIVKRVSWLGQNFHRVVPEPLSGEFKGTFKLRVGAWRVIYTIESDILVIRLIGHRGEIYR